jgi:O-antigen/teichoic acid export membrane protein
MNLLKRNIASNFAGRLWQALMSLIFIPIYIHLLGIEAWGLIGIFATLQTVFGLLDVGMSSTLNREMARLSVVPHKAQEMRDLVRTLEAIYWSVAGFVGLFAVSSASFIAHHWINEGQLSGKTVEQALVIMGLVMALQMPSGFYSGGLMGLQKQVLLNAINIGTSTLRGVGAIAILRFVSPTIQAFFLWQLAVGAVNTVVLAVVLWRSLPRAESRLKRNRRPRGGADDADALLVGDNCRIRDLAAAAKGFLQECPDESYDPYGLRAPTCRRWLRDLPLQPKQSAGLPARLPGCEHRRRCDRRLMAAPSR